MKLPSALSDPYLQFAFDFSERERHIQSVLNEWLPDTIVDVHCHANGAQAARELTPTARRQVRASFPAFSVEESILLTPLIYPGKTIRRIRFSNPYRGIDHKLANSYLLENSPAFDEVALCGLPDDVDYTVRELGTGNYVGLKMYPFYFEPPANKILEYFPDDILAAAEDADLPIILHTFKLLADCIEEVIDIAVRFPRLRIVLAHLGRHQAASARTLEVYRVVARFPQFYTDVSMATNTDVYKQVLATFGPERVLFGTDEPFNLLRYIDYEHPILGRRLVSTYPYHWLDESQRKEYGHLAANAMLVHWQMMTALKQALEDIYPIPDDLNYAKQCIFYENAFRAFPWRE